MYKKKCSFLLVNNFFLNNLYFFQTKLATCLAVEKKFLILAQYLFLTDWN